MQKVGWGLEGGWEVERKREYKRKGFGKVGSSCEWRLVMGWDWDGDLALPSPLPSPLPKAKGGISLVPGYHKLCTNSLFVSLVTLVTLVTLSLSLPLPLSPSLTSESHHQGSNRKRRGGWADRLTDFSRSSLFPLFYSSRTDPPSLAVPVFSFRSLLLRSSPLLSPPSSLSLCHRSLRLLPSASNWEEERLGGEGGERERGR
ncbi:hypothetical protein IE53DRAFT_79500 [Violaceomyces palustris]|uniref:Uncharacterized protein n=1 Tax=Violaceomyces palustris TaxID=1673888 RepID=A0ACD0NY84_9BASI|nr:hypothetical protein IE53DRAFT_79500 [Violaceomyces palustris]